MLVHAAGGQTHSQTHALLNDGALQEDVLAQLALLTGDDGVGDLAHQVVGLLALDIGVSHAGDLGKHLTADLDDRVQSIKTALYGHGWYRAGCLQHAGPDKSIFILT